MFRLPTATVWALLTVGLGALAYGIATAPFSARSASPSSEVQLPAKTSADQRTTLDLELGFDRESRGTAVIVRDQPSGEVIGTVTPFGLGANGGTAQFALTVPRHLEARLRRENQPLRLELDAAGVGSRTTAVVTLRSVAVRLVPASD